MGGLYAELKRRNVVRVGIAYVAVSWLILQFSDLVLENTNAPDWVMQVIMLVLAIGLPLALLFAWAFELTPEGIKREKDVDRDKSVTHETGRKLNFIIIGVLVVALAASLYGNFAGDEPIQSQSAQTSANERTSIAVLPFANRSPNASDAFFVDGMHDDLLTQLAKISALKVISRTSVMQYRDTDKGMREIGDELGVSTLLEGGVQRAGDRIRINVQLIDADTDEHLWAETYSRQLTPENIFEIQEEIVSQITRALHATLSPQERERLSARPTEDLQAYEAYLLARQRMQDRTVPALKEAVGLFQTAIDRDEGFVLAYAGLAESYMVLNNAGEYTLKEMLGLVRPVVAKAQSINREDGAVYNIMAGLAEYEGDIDKAERYYRRAIELSPSYSLAYHWLALLLTNYTGGYDEARELYWAAIELDPLAVSLHSNLAAVLWETGDVEEALRILGRANAINPNAIDIYRVRGAILAAANGRLAEALRWQQRAAQMDTADFSEVVGGYLLLGDLESAKQWQAAFMEQFPDSVHSYRTSMALNLQEGDIAAATELAEELLSMSRDTVYMGWPLRVIRDYSIQSGDAGRAFDRYLKIYPELFANEPIVNRSNIGVAVDLVLLMRSDGRHEEASQLASSCFELLHSFPVLGIGSSGILKAKLHAILDDREAALEALEAAIDEGWTITVEVGIVIVESIRTALSFASLAEDPRFIEQAERVEARIADQLRIVREMEQDGRLAARPEQLPDIEFDLSL